MLTNKVTFGKTHAAFIFVSSHESIVFLRKNQKRNIATFRVKIRLYIIQIRSFSRKYPPQNVILLCINDLTNTIYYRSTISKMNAKYEHESIVNLKRQVSQNLGMRVYCKLYTTFHRFLISIFISNIQLILIIKVEKWTQNMAMRVGRVNMNQPNTVMRVLWIWTKICEKLSYFLPESNINLGQNIWIKICL